LPPVEQLVERDLLNTDGEQAAATGCSPPSAIPSGKTLDDILTPVREEFERSGMADEELASLIEGIREEIWQEKQAPKGP
jgi:hypothetical protein